MIIKHTQRWIAYFMVLGFVLSPCFAAEPIDPAKVAELASSIQQNLDPILTGVNEQKRPTKAELAAWQKFLTESRRYFQKLEPAQQSQFMLLDAWVSYFNGNMEQAHKNAVLAWNKDQTSSDALVTQIAMALVANKRPMLPKPQKNKTPQTQDPMGMPGMPMDPGMGDMSQMIQPGKLTLDYKTLIFGAIGKTMDAQSLDCLNGTTFTYQPGQEAMCILVWRKYDPNTAENEPNLEQTNPAMGMGMPPAMPSMETYAIYGQSDPGSPTAAFGKLFQRGITSGQIKFLGLNLDLANRENDILKEIIDSPSPWAQVMAVKQKHKVTLDANIQKVPANRPILVMVDKTGAIRYAGPAVGFIAPMLLSELSSAQLKPLPAQTAPTSSDSSAQPAAEPAAQPMTTVQPAQTPPPAAAPATQFRELSEEESIQAEQLLAPTRDLFMKTGRKHITTYKNGIEMCRKVMRDFPGTKYAYEAQMLLRQVPENQRGRYGITDQELGL